MLTGLVVQNYRSLAKVTTAIGPLNLFFGPNGAGKSTLLDTIWFVRDCAIRSVELASSDRDHGIGLLFDGAEDGAAITIELSTREVRYELTLNIGGGRIEPFAGEVLHSLLRDKTLIRRLSGSETAEFYHPGMDQHFESVKLREPEKLSLSRYLDFAPECVEAADLDRLLHFVHFYHSRSFFLHKLKTLGSSATPETWVRIHGENLWSVLRNLEGRRRLDDRYDTIMGYMEETFPSFHALIVEPSGPASVYARFMENHRREPIMASGVSDGHLQMLILLTALFSEGRGRYSMMLLDEPEISLHPWALSVLAKAIRDAAENWNRQVLMATHSPVLISQFTPNETVTIEPSEGGSKLCRLSEIPQIADLLNEYAAGTLYMSELIASQGGLATPVDGEVR